MEGKKYLTLNDLNAYKVSFNLSNHVWNVIMRWDHFSKETIGKQLARAIDSISSNIAEGFGRHSKKDKIKFYKYSRGSIYESLDWLEKSKIRKIISVREYECIFNILKVLPREINHLISFTESRLVD